LSYYGRVKGRAISALPFVSFPSCSKDNDPEGHYAESFSNLLAVYLSPFLHSAGDTLYSCLRRWDPYLDGVVSRIQVII